MADVNGGSRTQTCMLSSFIMPQDNDQATALSTCFCSSKNELSLVSTVYIVAVHRYWLYADAVQAATWIKQQFALKPAISRLRRERAAQRPLLTNQIDDMY